MKEMMQGLSSGLKPMDTTQVVSLQLDSLPPPKQDDCIRSVCWGSANPQTNPSCWGEACTDAATWSSLSVKQCGELCVSAWASCPSPLRFLD